VSYPRNAQAEQSDAEVELSQTTRAQVRELLRPRVENLLEQIEAKLVASGLQSYAGGRIVVTGGAAQLLGLPVFAGRRLGTSVRLGAPMPFAGLGPSACSPAFAAAVGLLATAADSAVLAADQSLRPGQEDGYLGRVGQWLRASF
jgi:cell division protein FtsA